MDIKKINAGILIWYGMAFAKNDQCHSEFHTQCVFLLGAVKLRFETSLDFKLINYSKVCVVATSASSSSTSTLSS